MSALLSRSAAYQIGEQGSVWAVHAKIGVARAGSIFADRWKSNGQAHSTNFDEPKQALFTRYALIRYPKARPYLNRRFQWLVSCSSNL